MRKYAKYSEVDGKVPQDNWQNSTKVPQENWQNVCFCDAVPVPNVTVHMVFLVGILNYFIDFRTQRTCLASCS